jgi:hypothetical protein
MIMSQIIHLQIHSKIKIFKLLDNFLEQITNYNAICAEQKPIFVKTDLLQPINGSFQDFEESDHIEQLNSVGSRKKYFVVEPPFMEDIPSK